MVSNKSVYSFSFRENVSKAREPLKLTTINDDCKEMIFHYLEWSDMISIADSSKQLRSAVCRAYNRKYRTAKVDFGFPCEDSFEMENRTKLICPDIFIMRKLDALKILRNFGHLITNLYVNWHDFEFRRQTEPILERYLNDYASGSLIQLTIGESVRSLPFGSVKKPFEKLKSLNIESCKLGQEVPFNTIFPCLKSLKLGNNVFENNSVIKLHFNLLIDLSIYFRMSTPCDKQFQHNDFIELLELNPQLEKLILCNVDFKSEFYSRLTTNCPKLKSIGFNGPLWSADLDLHHFELVEELFLNEIDDTRTLTSLTFSKLKYLKIRNYTCAPPVSSTDISKFILKNPHITSLTVECEIDDLSNFFRIESLLLNIEELYIDVLQNEIPSGDLMNFLSQNRSLKRFSLTAPIINFRHVCNEIIARRDGFKIRNKAIEFEITRRADNYAKKYVTRVVTMDFADEHAVLYVYDNDKRIFQLCSYAESTHLLSHKYYAYKKALESLFTSDGGYKPFISSFRYP